MALFPIFKRGKKYESSLTFDYDYEEPSRAYLKKMALETVISFIARSVSMSDFRIVEKGKRVFNNEHYGLNVRPNTDQSAADFWFHFVHKLIYEGEVLVVKTDSADLLIVDSFVRKERAVYPDTFTDVTVKDYTFQRTFSMDEVVYLKFGNEKLTKFMDGMFKDYTDLFNRLVEINLRSNQIRATVNIEANQALDAKRQTQLQEFINNMYKAFREKAVAIVPKLKGFEYDEIADGNTSSQSVEDIAKLKASLIDEVADILGVPQKLIHGDIADIDSLMKSYIKFCIDPINKLIADELNAKFISKADYLKGDRINVIGITIESSLDLLAKADKGVASGIINPDEGREMIGLEPTGLPEMQTYYITKNYEKAEHSKGGEKNENKTSV
ncbi:MAG: phage portal protein [Lysinibacillus sp.]